MSGEGIFTIHPNIEENSFDLDFNDEEYDGGSYLIFGDGSVVNMSVTPNERYGSINSTPTQIKNKFIDIQKQYKNAEFKDLIRNDGSVYGKQMVSELKYAGGGELELETWREDGVSENEKMDYNKLTRSEVKGILKELGYNVTKDNFSKFHKKSILTI